MSLPNSTSIHPAAPRTLPWALCTHAPLLTHPRPLRVPEIRAQNQQLSRLLPSSLLTLLNALISIRACFATWLASLIYSADAIKLALTMLFYLSQNLPWLLATFRVECTFQIKPQVSLKPSFFTLPSAKVTWAQPGPQVSPTLSCWLPDFFSLGFGWS